MKSYMDSVSVEDAIRAGRTDTLCWDCKHAMNAGCCWADPEIAQPVPGWTATESGSRDFFSYTVHACPEFDRATYGYGRYRTADDYILALEIALQQRKKQLAVLKRWPDNYRKMNQRLQKQNEKLTNKVKILQMKIEKMEEDARERDQTELPL